MPLRSRYRPAPRAKLLRMEPEKHLLLLTIHHIVSDGWSMGVLHHELFTLYGAFIQGRRTARKSEGRFRSPARKFPHVTVEL